MRKLRLDKLSRIQFSVLPISILMLMTILSSCKKERTCSCSTELQGTTSSFDTTFAKMTKKEAQKECFKFNDGGDDGAGGIAYTTCELK